MPEELRNAAASSVLIETDGSTGSGTMVAHSKKNSYVLSCYHVLREFDAPVEILYKSGKKFNHVRCKVVHDNKKMDLVLLKTSRRIKIPTIMVARQEPDLYERVYMVGALLGLYGTAADGILCGKKGSNIDNPNLWQVTGLFVSGISGGSLVNTEGELIGVPVSMARADEIPIWSIGFAVPLPKVRRFLLSALRDGKMPGTEREGF